jgi:hypothetical protein
MKPMWLKKKRGICGLKDLIKNREIIARLKKNYLKLDLILKIRFLMLNQVRLNFQLPKDKFNSSKNRPVNSKYR